MERYGQILQPGAPPTLPAPRFREMSWPAKALVTGVLLAAVARLLYDLARTSFASIDWGGLVVLTAGALLAQFFGVSVRRYAIYHVTPLFIFAALFLLGLGPVGILIIVSYAIGGWRRRQGWPIVAFNASAHFLAAYLASRAYSAVAPVGHMLSLTGGWGLLTAAAIYVVVNHALVLMGLYFIRGRHLFDAQTINVEGMATDFLLLCIGCGFVLLWQVQPALSVFAIIPLIFIYRVLDIPTLREEARIDPKTGLYNARHGNAVLEMELQRAAQLQHPVCVLMADLDGLRRVNNTYGHLTGDDVLKKVADVIRSTIGARGVAVRFGGEEFVVVLPGCDAEEGRAVAERIRKGVEEKAFFPPGASQGAHVTITVGVAAYPDDARNAIDLLNRADAALYYGKDHGRNQVCTANVIEERFTKETGDAVAEAAVDANAAGGSNALAADATSTTNVTSSPLTTQQSSAAPVSHGLAALIAIVTMAGAALYGVYLVQIGTLDWSAALMLIVLAWAGEALALDLYTESTVSLSFVALLASAFLLGPVGVAVVAPVEALTHAYQRRPQWYKVAFNLAGNMLAGTAASFVFGSLGVKIGIDTLPLLILPSALAAGVYYLVNVGLVALAVALASQRQPLQVWREQFQWLWIHYIALGFIALVLAVAYVGLGIYGVLAFLVPLFIVRYAQKQSIDRTADSIRALKELNQDLMAANAEVRQMNEELLSLLAKIIDSRDPYVYNHSEQVAAYAVALARELGLPPAQVDLVRRMAICHDLGKVGIPDAILNKPARLTDSEYQAIQEHVTIGAALLESSRALHRLIPGVQYHHERWDGKGYPDRIAGEQIPLEARILAIADVVEALASDRPYKRGMSAQQILAELRRSAGSQLDPALVEAFIRVVEREGDGFIVNSARRVAPSLRTQWAPRAASTPA